MPQRDIRYIGSAWQVTALPDGTKELSFVDPDGITVHILPLPKHMAEAAAAQLRGEVEPLRAVPDPPPASDLPGEPDPPQGGDTILPDEPYPPEEQYR